MSKKTNIEPRFEYVSNDYKALLDKSILFEDAVMIAIDDVISVLENGDTKLAIDMLECIRAYKPENAYKLLQRKEGK